MGPRESIIPRLLIHLRLVGRGNVLISYKIFVAMLIWTTISILISLSAGVEVLVTLILIGLLVVRELTDSFLTKEIRMRMDFFIYAGLLLFVVVVLRRVLLVLS